MGVMFYSDGVCGSNTELNRELNVLICEEPPFFNMSFIYFIFCI